MKCQNLNCPSTKPLRYKSFLKHLQNFRMYGKCYAPQIRKKTPSKEFPKLCKNPDCPMQKPLSKKTWNMHYAQFQVEGICPRQKKGRPSINAFAKDVAKANMIDNLGEDGKDLMNFLKGNEPSKRAKIESENMS